MGMLVNGQWQREDLREFARDGSKVRFDSGFHDAIRADGSTAFLPESGHYALYCNWTCPWSHRALVTRAQKGLTATIDLVLLEPSMGKESWWFGERGRYVDPALGATHLHTLYSASNPGFTGRVSVPVLWDKHTRRIVNNDSGAIARLFNNEFNALAEHPERDFYPLALRPEIDALNEFVAERLNDGVYRCLLAKDQAQYEAGFDRVFGALDELETRLAHQRYLLGNSPTEPDWRLFACLVRFDAVYYPLYKCNLRRVVDYPNLWAYTRDLYQLPAVAGTVNLAEIKAGYYGMIGRGGMVPKGPLIDFNTAHGRAERFA